MEPSSYTKVMTELKAILKQKRLSYAQISKKIEVPEATLKKWMSADDGAFSRMTTMCEVLGISITDVLKKIENQNVHTFEMTNKQQEFFLGDRRAFEIYWLLVYERYTPDKIEARLQMTNAEVKRTLLRLARLDLIEVGLKDKLFVPKTQPVRWSPTGKFMQKIFREWSQDITQSALRSEMGQDLILQFFQLTKESERSLREDILKLEEKYARLTIRELGGSYGEARQLRFLAAVASGSFI